MAQCTLIQELEILADAAKYDAFCASSGSAKRNALASGAIGSTAGMGICHSYTPDGRCISLLTEELLVAYALEKSAPVIRKAMARVKPTHCFKHAHKFG